MKTAGIVAEYNPFHRGHAWHIAQTRRALGEDGGIVCVMSGHWVQRGECALADKWSRTKLALAGGADLVLELPTPWAMATAETFARGAVGLLAATGVVDVLSFGSECGDAGRLGQIAGCLDSPRYRAGLARFLGQGMTFAACRQAAVKDILGTEAARLLSGPNNNLGVEYLRALNALHSGIAPLAVLRRGAEHHGVGVEPGFAPAAQIRALIRAGDWGGAGALLPGGSGEALRGIELAELVRCERAVLARLRTMTPVDWAALPDGGAAEGLPERLTRAAGQARTLEEFYTLAKTKRYPHARLRRLAVGAFLGLKAAQLPQAPAYLRVLGFNARGQGLLREMKEKAALPVLTKPAHAKGLDGEARRLFELESRCTDLYALCLEHPWPCGREYTTGPVLTAPSAVICAE